MLIRTFAVAAGLCFASSAAIAQESAQPDAAPPAKEKKICRAAAPTGSIMAKRVCMTKAEWAKVNAQNERHSENLRDNRNRGGMSGAQ